MKSSELRVGLRYKIRYREFINGKTAYSSPLINGIGKLVSKYSVDRWNHEFELSDGTRVWATPHSIKELSTGTISDSSTLVDDLIEEDSKDIVQLQRLSQFLEGLGVRNEVSHDKMTINSEAANHFMKILYKIYGNLLMIED